MLERVCFEVEFSSWSKINFQVFPLILHKLFKMANADTSALKQTIANGISDLSEESLQEIADFVLFIRAKKQHKIAFTETQLVNYIQRELSALSKAEQMHVEEEFADYPKKHPVE